MLHDTEVARTSHTSSASAQPAQTTSPAEGSAISDSPDLGGERSQILRHILEHSAPAELRTPWSFLPATNGVRTLRCEPPELIASLQSSFPPEALLAAQVLIHGPDQETQLTPVLRGTSKFLVLRDDNRRAADLVGDAGALFRGDPPCFMYAGPRASSDRPPARVFVCSMDDLQVFYRLKLPCTSAAGLASLDGQQVRRLYANLSALSPPRCRLTLVGWSIADLEHKLPEYVESILQRLSDINSVYQAEDEFILFDLWEPTERDCQSIRTAISFGDRQLIRDLVLDNVDCSVTRAVDVWSNRLDPVETDLASCHAELIRTISAPGPWGFGSNVKAVMVRLRAAIEQVTTRRFLQAASDAPDPLQSETLLLRAEVIQDLNQCYGPLSGARTRDGYNPTLSEERLQQIERCTNLLLKLDRLSPNTK